MPYILQGVLLASAVTAGIFYLKLHGVLRLEASVFRFIAAAGLGVLSAPIGIVTGTLFTFGTSVLITPAGLTPRQAIGHVSYAVVLLATVGTSAGVFAGICALSVALYILSHEWIHVAMRAFVLAGLFCIVMAMSDLIVRSNLFHAAGDRSGAPYNVQTDILLFGQPLFCAVSGYWLIRSSVRKEDRPFG
ncbi:MAG: hypothetical protein ACJ71Q_14320 [Terriglobales bacterium]